MSGVRVSLPRRTARMRTRRSITAHVPRRVTAARTPDRIDLEDSPMSIADISDERLGGPASTSARRRTTCSPSRARSAACCSPRMPSPTSSRRCAAPTSTSPSTSSIFDAILDALLARRADRRHRGHRRAHQDRRAAARRRRRLPPHAHRDRADRGERRLLRVDRRRAGAAAPPRRGRHPHRADGLRGRGRGRSTSSTTRRPRSTAVTGADAAEDYVPLDDAVDAADRRDRGRRAAATAR